MVFDDLRLRLLRLRNDDLTPQDGLHGLKTVGILAARAIQQDDRIRQVLGVPDDLWPVHTVNPAANEAKWWLTWQALCGIVASRYPANASQLSSSMNLESTSAYQGDDPRNAVICQTFVGVPERWQQTIENHAVVLGILSELSCQDSPAIDSSLEIVWEGTMGDAATKEYKVSSQTIRNWVKNEGRGIPGLIFTRPKRGYIRVYRAPKQN